jgi:tetratricopeptide (TPR) repeat protein
VISPNSTSYFDGADQDLSRIDEDLGVRYLLRGSVRRDASRARISAQLLEASTGNQLWAETYDVELAPSELLAIQERIARRIASTIGDTTGVLVHAGQREVRRAATDSLEAYECVLLAQRFFKVHTPEVHALARACLERAVEIDPDYAEAWAHLANIYRDEYFHGWRHAPDPLERAMRAAKRAIDLDGSSSMAHYALSLTLLDRHQFEPAVAAAERALALNPNDSALAAGLSLYLAKAGRLERALTLTNEVERLNPLHPDWIHGTRALIHYEKGEYEQARAEAVKVAPGFTASIYLAASHGRLGQESEAREVWQEFVEREPEFATDAIELLRRALFREAAVQGVVEGLRLAGIELD